MMEPEVNEGARPTDVELAYIKYSAKELLFYQGQKIEKLQADVNTILLNMVSRAELTSARRWAVTAAITAVGALAGFIGIVL